MSTIVGGIVGRAKIALPTVPGYVIASELAILAGAIICFLGLIRWGWLVEFISLASITAFMTGSAINIAVGQVPTLMGIGGFNTRDHTYKVVINILKHLGRTKIDAAMGLTALFLLYFIRFTFNQLAKRHPSRAKAYFFLNTLRTAFVILLYTFVSWLVNRHSTHHTKKEADRSPFKILGRVPRGFQHAQVPIVNKEIARFLLPELVQAIIVLVIEHVSIAKSFGRVNNYVIDPSQELVAIGVTNLLGPFLGAYPATGSFSRTAIKSKAGVRTPFAGVITAVVVLLAIYALPAVFFFIPSAALSAVIIHAVGDLITPPNTVYQFYKVSPLEVIVFFAGVIVTIFTTIDIGIYVTVATSFFLYVWRLFHARGRFLGRVQVHSVVGDHLLNGDDGKFGAASEQRPTNDPDKSTRNIFVPLDHGDGSNPEVRADHPYPGVFIYRFSEALNYPNANSYLDHLTHEIFKVTRRTNRKFYARRGDRPWNDPGPRRGQAEDDDSQKPTLKAIILDFSSVNNVDITAVQNLIDVRNQLDRYASPQRVQWHFACINNRWAKRSLVNAGFGYPTSEDDAEFRRWKPVFSVAEIGGDYSAAAAAENAENKRQQRLRDVEVGGAATRTGSVGEIGTPDSSSNHSVDKQIATSKAYGKSRVAVAHGINRPYFHLDLTSALQSAINGAERADADYAAREAAEAKGHGYA